MALLTDDQDIREVTFWMEHGGNGDYYINLYDKDRNQRLDTRIAMSGGNAPTEVKLAIANLFRAMEFAKLNNPLKHDN